MDRGPLSATSSTLSLSLCTNSLLPKKPPLSLCVFPPFHAFSCEPNRSFCLLISRFSFMAAKLSHNSFLSPSSSNPWLPSKPNKMRYTSKNVSDLDQLLSCWGNSRKRCLIRFVLWEKGNQSVNFRPNRCRTHYLTFKRSRRIGNLLPFSAADDGITVNGTPQATASSDVEEVREKLSRSLNGNSDSLVQFLHESARVFELAIKEQNSFLKLSWFSTAWLGVDGNASVKALAYQASAYSLLQAASEIASQGDGRDKDVNDFVQRSLIRQSACLESSIRDKISTKQPEAYDCFWSEQVPRAVTSFVNYIEGDPCFTVAASVSWKGPSTSSIKSTDVSMLMFALTCNAAFIKLGPAKVSCSQFFSTIPDITGKLMDMLVDLIPIRQAYHSLKEIGLGREFLVHFGPRAALCRITSDRDSEEVVFWVDRIQKQLQRAIDREKIWSRLTTSESIEVLDRDLAIFGFFIALGRCTQSFLSSNGFDVTDHPLEGFVRFLIGGSVLYYPQLSSISSYQLYVEVVCEELDWLPFYPGNVGTPKESHGHRSKGESPPTTGAILQVLDVCSHWMQSFIKYSKWLENASNVKAAKFLSRGHNKLMECMDELGILNDKMMENHINNSVVSVGGGSYTPTEKESDSFDKALESVEEALTRLENLLQYLHVSSSNSGKEHLKAACSDLEKIRKLKKELIELEKRVQRSADQSDNGEVIELPDDSAIYSDGAGAAQLVQVGKKGTIIEKSIDKLKQASTDVWQGTQLLAIDVAASTGLVRKALIGDELTEKEKKALRRTLTDLASVVPIGVLMLLPVTAVGHAAMLAAIQRYVPALIPSAYGPERLDLLRQLEKVKEFETSEESSDENVEELAR